MQLRFGSLPVVVGSSAEMARLLLKTHDVNFPFRPKTTASKYLTYNYSNITWSQNASYIRQARKIFLTELFNPKRLDSLEYIRKEEMSAMLKHIHSSTNKSMMITLKEYILKFNFNVISRMTLGKKYIEESENAIIGPDEFKEMLDEFTLLTGVLNIGDLIPWLDFLDLQGYVKRMKKVGKKLDKFLEQVLDEHNQRREGVEDCDAKDMVDALLQYADGHDPQLNLQRHQVKALIQDLLVGGIDTSNVTIEWAMSEVLKNPKLMVKAHEELDEIIGRERWVEEKDIVNLPYINAIMKETMRLHPVVPLLVPRAAQEDCQIEGHDLLKGTQVVVNTWSIGRDPKIWERAEEFDPHRFMEKKIDVKGHNFELLPFGSGRRMCPGYSLGLRVIQTGLANLLHGFLWKLPHNMKSEDLNMDEIFGLTTPRKIPLTAQAQPRLPHHLY